MPPSFFANFKRWADESGDRDVVTVYSIRTVAANLFSFENSVQRDLRHQRLQIEELQKQMVDLVQKMGELSATQRNVMLMMQECPPAARKVVPSGPQGEEDPGEEAVSDVVGDPDAPSSPVNAIDGPAFTQMPTFTGSYTVQFDDWLRRFNDFGDAHSAPWDDKQKLLKLKFFLVGAARDRLDELTDDQKRSFATATKHLGDLFKTPAQQAEAKSLLSTCYQELNEDIATFMDRLKKLLMKAFPTKSKDRIDPEIQFFLTQKAPSNYKAALEVALKLQQESAVRDIAKARGRQDLDVKTMVHKLWEKHEEEQPKRVFFEDTRRREESKSPRRERSTSRDSRDNRGSRNSGRRDFSRDRRSDRGRSPDYRYSHRDFRDSRDYRDSRGYRDRRDSRDYYNSRDYRDRRDSHGYRDSQDPRGSHRYRTPSRDSSRDRQGTSRASYSTERSRRDRSYSEERRRSYDSRDYRSSGRHRDDDRDEQKPPRCYRCRRVGHVARFCYAQFPAQPENNVNSVSQGAPAAVSGIQEQLQKMQMERDALIKENDRLAHIFDFECNVINPVLESQIEDPMDWSSLEEDVEQPEVPLQPQQEQAAEEGTRYPQPVLRQKANGWSKLLGLSLLMLLVIAKSSASLVSPNPLICDLSRDPVLNRLPMSVDCPRLEVNPHDKPQNATIDLFKPNVVQYETIATLCKVVTSKVEYYTNLVGDNFETKSTKTHLIQAAECRRMIETKECAFGKLVSMGSIMQTANELTYEWHWHWHTQWHSLEPSWAPRRVK